MKKMIEKITALLLALCLLTPATAFAESGEETEDYGILDPAALTEIVESYCAGHGLRTENMSIGYCYTPTGDTWYYNGDAWYYSASMYKVPLMMILAERYKAGEITDETKISGLTLDEANYHVLVNSNNDYAHAMMHYIGTDAECRTLYQQYADLPEDYYVQNFYDYSYFTARFMTQVMETLYFEADRFPNVIESLKRAQAGHYFHATLPEYEIAQKYGSFQDASGTIFNHTTGIVYTPNPFIVTVMTKNMGQSETFLSDLAKRYEQYTLTLDEQLPAYQAAQQAELDRQAAEAQASAEEAQAAAEPETVAADPETAAAAPAVTEVPAAPAPGEATAQEQTAAGKPSHGTPLGKGIAVGVIAVSSLLILGIGVSSSRSTPQRGKKKRSARRNYR